MHGAHSPKRTVYHQSGHLHARAHRGCLYSALTDTALRGAYEGREREQSRITYFLNTVVFRALGYDIVCYYAIKCITCCLVLYVCFIV
jgi:hypothetical protein